MKLKCLSFSLLIIVFSTFSYSNQQQWPIYAGVPEKIKQHLDNTSYLEDQDLIDLVSGNSMFGVTCRSKSPYELYFQPDGQVIFRKNLNQDEVYIGKWWVEDNCIHSQWPTYKNRPTVNKLHYYHLIDNIYMGYTINNVCGPVVVIQGDMFKLSTMKME